MAPPLPGGFIERPRETEELITLLRAGETASPAAITTALRGAGGFGKTTLAAAVCHDDRVTEVFDDGVLWATLGQTPNLLNEVMKLYAALTGERPIFVDLEDAQRELELRIEHRNCLIVIDDVWQAAHLKPFLRGGKGCARLITTRLFDVAADATRVDVDQMEQLNPFGVLPRVISIKLNPFGAPPYIILIKLNPFGAPPRAISIKLNPIGAPPYDIETQLNPISAPPYDIEI
jgi:hypothetical protein